MELHEMKLAWRELSDRIERGDARTLSLQREWRLDKARSTLRRWLWLPAIEFGFGLAMIWIAGLFLARNFALIGPAPGGAIPSLLLLLLAVAAIAISIRQFALIGGIDYAGPVVAIQRRLSATRALRIRMTQCDLLLGLPLWPVFLAFVLQCIGGYASYRALDAAWLVWNALFGLMLAAALIFVARRYREQLSRSPVIGKLADEIAGQGLTAALGQLDEIAHFERG